MTGVFTHFACADDLTPTGVATTDAQVAGFREVLAALDARGLGPGVVHASNSAGLLGRDDARFDLVRPGIAVYGLPPGPDVPVADLQPALAWKAQVAQVHDLPAGASVGYGHTWTADRPSRVATVPVGYADGLRRAPATWRHVLVRGPARPGGRTGLDGPALGGRDRRARCPSGGRGGAHRAPGSRGGVGGRGRRVVGHVVLRGGGGHPGPGAPDQLTGPAPAYRWARVTPPPPSGTLMSQLCVAGGGASADRRRLTMAEFDGMGA